MKRKFFLFFQVLLCLNSYSLKPSYVRYSSNNLQSSACNQQHLSKTQLYQSSSSTQVVPQKEAVAQLLTKGGETMEDALLHFKRYFSSYYRDEKSRFRNITHSEDSDKRPRLVVVGSGWAAHALLKTIEAEDYHVICVSPRPFFIFTPMLASCTTGTVEYRSILEPIREANPFVDYVEGEVIDIEPKHKFVKVISSLQKRKSITPPASLSSIDTYSNRNSDMLTSSSHYNNDNRNNNNQKEKEKADDGSEFLINYDYLVYAAGATVADFGTPGVKQYCHFIKEIDDVRAIKNKILTTFELASLPTTSISDFQSLLTFVVVGGGPTGVEFAGELCDFIKQDMARLYPRLLKQVKIVLLNAGSTVLNAFDSALQAQALESLRAEGIDILLNARVLGVTETEVTYKTKTSDEKTSLPFGLCVWAAGTTPRPLTTALAHKLGDEQVQSVLTTGRLKVDAWMRVTGLENAQYSPPSSSSSSVTQDVTTREDNIKQTESSIEINQFIANQQQQGKKLASAVSQEFTQAINVAKDTVTAVGTKIDKIVHTVVDEVVNEVSVAEVMVQNNVDAVVAKITHSESTSTSPSLSSLFETPTDQTKTTTTQKVSKSGMTLSSLAIAHPSTSTMPSPNSLITTDTAIPTTVVAATTSTATAAAAVVTLNEAEKSKQLLTIPPPSSPSALEGSIIVIGDSSYFNWGYNTTLEHSGSTSTASTTATCTSADKTVSSICTSHTSTSLLLPLVPTSTALPQTAQVAAQQGAYVARLLNRGYDLTQPTPVIKKANLKSDFFKMVFKNKEEHEGLTAKPFAFFNLGLLAYIGDSKAVAQMQLGDISSILFASGKEAFFIWRSVYLVKQVSARTRVLVLFDFIKTKVFGRDLTGI